MERLLHQKFAGFSPVFKFPNGGHPGVAPFPAAALQQARSLTDPVLFQLSGASPLSRHACVGLRVTILIRGFLIYLH